ncbi:MAG: HAD family hydrolase [Spirochaetaceae bacterium]|jgi:putative hydrolase of the HAD superfamily|nr:HAD family hydrolase [Spirochaetaceae bacterium]
MITAIGFDIDGTLYPPLALYGRLIPFTVAHIPLMLAFRKTRAVMHDEPVSEGAFYRKQAAVFAGLLNIDASRAEYIIEENIYQKWTEIFKRVKPYPCVAETLHAFKDAGYKLGVLSDFPIREKLVNMRLDGYWDAEISSEETGAVKPAASGFLALAEKLATPPENILYVGNSYRFDVEGAAAAGMKTALRVHPLRKTRRFSGVHPDIVFSHYRELQQAVL